MLAQQPSLLCCMLILGSLFYFFFHFQSETITLPVHFMFIVPPRSILLVRIGCKMIMMSDEKHSRMI